MAAAIADRSRVTAPTARPAARGPLWRLTSRFTAASRDKRLRLFIELMRPTPSDSILDVGATDTTWRSSNFLEARYPWPERITALAPRPLTEFSKAFPIVRVVEGDGRQLPFADGAFDIGFSNAVIEHVGSRDDQRRFVAEMTRVCGRVFIATPNSRFPIDPHTLLPVLHWLPRSVRHPLLQLTGNRRWATEAALNPLNAAELAALFPAATEPRIVRQRVLGLTSVLIAVTDRRAPR